MPFCPQQSLPAVPRIAILGAGPAGLTAAWTLRELGYSQVTIFEQMPRVGGKVHSLRTPNGIVELGAVLASVEYDLVLDLARRYAIEYRPYPASLTFLDEHGCRHSAMSFLRSRYTQAALSQAFTCYADALERFVPKAPAELNHADPELFLPFGQFAERHGFGPVAELARSVLVGFGYGQYDSTPALYLMQIIGWLFKKEADELRLSELYLFPGGFQSLWEALARDFDVRLNSRVTSIQSHLDTPGSALTLQVNHSQHCEFDALLISAPLNQVGAMLHWAGEEQALFAKVRSQRYLVNLFRAHHLQTGEFLFLHENARRERLNHMNAWANRTPQNPLYIGWQQADRELSEQQLSGILAEDISQLGGELDELLLRQEWDYFPRVDNAALRGGFFNRLAVLQGCRGVFYIGASLAFETVEHSARQAQALVRKHFPAQL